MTFEQLWELAGGDEAAVGSEAIEPADLHVWSWVPGETEPEWMLASVLTKRDYHGELVEVRTKMGRRVRVTPDHPFVVGDGKDDEVLTRVLARDLTESDWLPLAVGAPEGFEPGLYSSGRGDRGRGGRRRTGSVRPERREIEALARRLPAERAGDLRPSKAGPADGRHQAHRSVAARRGMRG